MKFNIGLLTMALAMAVSAAPTANPSQPIDFEANQIAAREKAAYAYAPQEKREKAAYAYKREKAAYAYAPNEKREKAAYAYAPVEEREEKREKAAYAYAPNEKREKAAYAY